MSSCPENNRKYLDLKVISAGCAVPPAARREAREMERPAADAPAPGAALLVKVELVVLSRLTGRRRLRSGRLPLERILHECREREEREHLHRRVLPSRSAFGRARPAREEVEMRKYRESSSPQTSPSAPTSRSEGRRRSRADAVPRSRSATRSRTRFGRACSFHSSTCRSRRAPRRRAPPPRRSRNRSRGSRGSSGPRTSSSSRKAPRTRPSSRRRTPGTPTSSSSGHRDALPTAAAPRERGREDRPPRLRARSRREAGERAGVLAATDLSDPSLPALSAGADEARETGCRLVALHVVELGSEGLRRGDRRLRRRVSPSVAGADRPHARARRRQPGLRGRARRRPRCRDRRRRRTAARPPSWRSRRRGPSISS